jgi:hypothetical protein
VLWNRKGRNTWHSWKNQPAQPEVYQRSATQDLDLRQADMSSRNSRFTWI